MTNDLISRSALKDHVSSYAGMFTDELGFAVSMEAVLRGIDFMESVDAVEVCRCKDCKYHSIIPHTDLYLCRKSYTGCRAEFFCADGERKGDDGT